jgi:hypothetical protein
MSCDINTINNIRESLLAQGYPLEEVEAAIELIKLRNSENSSIVDSMLESETKTRPILSNTERKELRGIFTTLTDRIDKVYGGIENFTESFDKAIESLLPIEDKTKLYDYLKRLKLGRGDLTPAGTDYISAIESEIKIQEAIGNQAFANELKQDLIKEKERIKKYTDANKKIQTARDKLLTKIQNLRKMAQLASALAEGSLSDIETEIANKISDGRRKVQEKNMELSSLEVRLDSLKQELKKYPKTGTLSKYVKEKRTDITKRITETKESIKKAKEGIKEAQSNLDAIIQEYVQKDVITKDGKLKDISPTLKKFLTKLQKEEKSTQEKLNKLGYKEFIGATRKVQQGLKQKLAKESKALREIRTGYKQRLGFLETYITEKKKSLPDGVDIAPLIDINFMVMMVGPSAVQYYLHNIRPKLDKPGVDGSDIDMSPLKPGEAIKILKTWRGRMTNSINNGFYSSDLSVLNDENLTYLQAIANNTTIIDLSNPNLFDMVIAPDMLPEQALSLQTLGTIPTENRAQTAAQLAGWIESTRNTLLSLKTAEGFTGTIPESLLRMALHQKLYDIASTAFTTALRQKAKRRNIQSGNFDELIGIKGLLETVGISNVNSLPEFKDPNWNNNFEQLVGFDIETDDTTVNEIRSIQLEVYENGKRVKYVYVNSNDSGEETLINSINTPTRNRIPLNKNQIETILTQLEDLQNKGFKVITFNGNSFDFFNLHNFIDDKNLLMRVSLRSIDLLRNLGFDNRTDTGEYSRIAPGGAKLKDLAQKNLPDAMVSAYGGKVRFRNGVVQYISKPAYTDEFGVEHPDTIEELKGGSDIKQYWKDGLDTGDWTKFDAYAQNDSMLTIDLARLFGTQDSTNVSLEYKPKEKGILAYSITTFKPRSNLFLSSSPNSDGQVTFSHIVDKLVSNNPELEEKAILLNFTYELEYDLNKVLDILDDWLIKAWALDPSNKPKLNLLLDGLQKEKLNSNLTNDLVIKIAKENRAVLKALLKKKFADHGSKYIDSFNGANGQLDSEVFTINHEKNTATLNKDALFRYVESEVEYEDAVYDYFEEFVKNNESFNQKAFSTRLINRFKVREILPNESLSQYYRNIIPEILKKYLPEFSRISDFGNGNLDWKSAYDMGIGLAQMLMDQKPGLIQIDNILISGDNVVSTLLLNGTSSVYQGRAKNFIIPDVSRVHFASPFGVVNEEMAYDNWRLLNRVKFILSNEISDEEFDNFTKFHDPDATKDTSIPISYFVNAQINTVFPDFRDRSPYSSLMTLDERKITAMEFMYQVPRLLSCFNHDCAYWGLNAGGRFLSDKLPTYYKEDFLSAGAPTAAAVLAGAIDQVAWMSVFDFGDENGEELLINSIKRAIELSRSVKPEELMNQTNKSDYRYSGLHITLAAFHFYADGSFEKMNTLFKALNLGNLEDGVVPASGLKDPRYAAIDAMDQELTLLKRDRNAYKTKYRLSDSELISLENVVKQLKSNRENAKEFLKGAITPRFYSAGFKGIFDGLVAKNADKELGFSVSEIRVVTKVLLRQLMHSHLALIDNCLGLNQDDISAVRKIFFENFKPVITKNSMANTFKENFFGELSYKDRRDQMVDYFTNYTNLLAEQLVPKRTKDREKKLEEVKAKFLKAYKDKLDIAASLFNKKDISTLSQDELLDLQNNVNQILSGSLTLKTKEDGTFDLVKGNSNGYNQHLILWALNRRAGVQYKLLDDNLELQRLVTGVHIDPKDYEHYLGRAIFHTYGLEIASGRNHMFGNWGNGPESSKLAQVRVEQGKEANPLGIWDVRDMDVTPDYWHKAFKQQVLIDLAPYYLPPTYNKETESRETYWKENEARSIKELEAQAFANYVMVVAARNPNQKIGDFTAADLKKKIEKYAGTPSQRIRLRTLVSSLGDKNNLMSADASVEGLASYRPAMADIDFSQRSTFALMEMQHVIRAEDLRESQLIKKIEEIKEQEPKDHNEIIPIEHRGHVSIFKKENLPFIPQQTSDTLSSLITGPIDPAAQRAIRIKNQVTGFAKVFGWDQLLDSKDWTRLYLLNQLRSRALIPALRIFQEGSPNSFDLAIKAKAEFFDGFFQTLGTRTKIFLKNKNYSTIDLMTNPEDIGISSRDIIAMRLKYGEGLSWFNVLRYLGKRIDRLAPITFGLVMDPGIIVRGKEGLIQNPTRSQPINIFGLEVRQIYKWILASEVFKRTATEYIFDNHPKLFDELKSKGMVDTAGFVMLEGIPLDEKMQTEIAQLAFRKTRELAIELNSKFSFVLTNQQLHMLHDKTKSALRETPTPLTGPIATQAIGDGFTITHTSVNNPNTLWAFTEDMVVQMLNSLANESLFKNVELAYQTGKDIGTVETDLDKLVKEEERQLFERMSALEEETFDALTLLHKLESDKDSGRTLLTEDYRNSQDGKPKLTVDIPSYFTSPIKLIINNQLVYTTLEESVFITDILQVAKIADNLGMETEAKEIKSLLLRELISSQQDIELDENSPYTMTSQTLIRLTTMLLKAEASIESLNGNKREMLVDFVQPGLTQDSKRKLLEKATTFVRLLQRVTNTNLGENNQYYYMASAQFDRADTIAPSIESDKKFQDSLIIRLNRDINNPDERQKVIKGIKKAYSDFTTLPQRIDISIPDVNFKKDITQFADKDKFILAFGNTGENIVNYLQGLVTQGLISQRIMDMKLIMIGSLAMHNRGILEDLNFESREDLGPSQFAEAAKKNNKYSIGLNIHAMKVTPENEILLKFAEELVHIARIKYMDVNNADYRLLMGAFNTKRSEPMIREMLMAMNLNKPYDLLEQDIKYATKNVEEFLSHYGAMILLQETIYRKDVLSHLEAKYEDVNKLRLWWNRAFYNIKYIAKRAHIKFTQLQNDPYYGEVYNTAYSVIQNLLFNGTGTGVDVGNPNMSFNAFSSFTTSQQTLTPEQKENVRLLSEQLIEIDRKLESGKLDSTTETTLKLEKEEINTRLQQPTINPVSELGLTEGEIQTELKKVKRVDGRIIQRSRPDLTTRALFAEGLNNWNMARGRRVDNSDTLAGMLRIIPDESDKLTRLLQNYFFQGYNQTNLTYNSPMALVVMLSDLIDNWTVTTQSTYLPSSTSGGFMANKLALDGYMGNLRHHTSIVGRTFTNLDVRERINLNVIRRLNGQPITVSDPIEIAAVDNITKAYQLWHTRLTEEMVNSRIKKPGSIQYLDKIGLKLKDSRLLSKEERANGFNAIRNLIRNKALKRLDEHTRNAVFSPYVAFLGGLMMDPNVSFVEQPDFQVTFEKFLIMADGKPAQAINGKEVIMKQIVEEAIEKYAIANSISISAARSQLQNANPAFQDIVKDTLVSFIYKTREHQEIFSELFTKVSNDELDLLLKDYRSILANNAASELTGQRFKALLNSDFGFYMGETQYSADYKPQNTPLDALVYEFLGKLGATAYIFDTRSPMLTSEDIFLENDPKVKDDLDVARAMFDGDIDSIGLSLLRGVGYDTVQRLIAEQVFGIQGFNFTFQQIISMLRGVIQNVDPSNKIWKTANLDGRVKTEDIQSMLLASLDRLETANKDARGTLGNRSSYNPVMDTLLRGGRAITQLTFGPNIPLATWAVEGTMGAIGGALRGNNPLTFLVDAIDQNVGSFVINNVGDLVRVRNGKVGMFNVDPPVLRNIAQNCLWLFEEMYSPMLPGKLTADGFSSEMIDRMSGWERFLAFSNRSNSASMKAIRVASENQANRRIAKDIQNRNLYRLRDSVNKILRNNPNPSNKVLREVIKDSGVSYNIEVLLAFVRAGLFETIETKLPGGKSISSGVLETIEYLMSKNKLDRGTIPMLAFFDLEYDLKTARSDTFGTTIITSGSVQAARTAMMKAMKSYANMAMVVNHPLDGTASATAHHAVLNFYKSYPGLYTAQFLMRRGSVTPAMQFAFELVLYSLADMSYNILLSLASGYYNYEKLKKALQQRDFNYREFVRLIMKYPLFSNNLFGFGSQAIAQVLTTGKGEQLVSSVAESAIGYDIRNIVKAIQGFAAWSMGDVPRQSPLINTYNVFGRVIPVLSSTLVKMLLMQSFGDLNYSGRRPGKRTKSSYVLDKVHAVSDDFIREKSIRNLFNNNNYNPGDKRDIINGGYLKKPELQPWLQDAVNSAQQRFKEKKQQQQTQTQPQVQQPQQPPEPQSPPKVSLQTIGTTPIQPPSGIL